MQSIGVARLRAGFVVRAGRGGQHEIDGVEEVANEALDVRTLLVKRCVSALLLLLLLLLLKLLVEAGAILGKQERQVLARARERLRTAQTVEVVVAGVAAVVLAGVQRAELIERHAVGGHQLQRLLVVFAREACRRQRRRLLIELDLVAGQVAQTNEQLVHNAAHGVLHELLAHIVPATGRGGVFSFWLFVDDCEEMMKLQFQFCEFVYSRSSRS